MSLRTYYQLSAFYHPSVFYLRHQSSAGTQSSDQDTIEMFMLVEFVFIIIFARCRFILTIPLTDQYMY